MKISVRSLFGFCRLSRKSYSSAGSAPKGRGIAVAMFSVALLLTTSCKEQVVSTATESPSHQQRKNYLTFKSFDEFTAAYEKIGNQSDVDQRVWDETHNFTSLRQLYQRVIAEEAANYDQEEKQYAANSSAKLTHKPSATLGEVSNMVLRDEVNGGVVLNLFMPKMASVLNKDGIVCVGKELYQFTFGATKSTLLSNVTDINKTTALFYKTEATNLTSRIYVGEVKHTRSPISVTNARAGDFSESFSCESASGSPQNWKMICYVDEVEYTVVSNDNPWGVTDTRKGGYITATIRTLGRGAFGSWNDRSSSEQRFGSANFRFRSGTILGSRESASSDLPGGIDACYRAVEFNQTIAFQLSPSSQTASFSITMFGNGYSNFAGPQGNPPANLRSATGTVYSANWNSYGCACNVTRSY